MEIAGVAVGLAAVVVVVRDIVHELFHPAGAGTLSRALRGVTWRLFRRLSRRRPERLGLAGPATLLVVFCAWTLLSLVGWALVFLPFMPQSFQYAASLAPAAHADFAAAFYLSLTALGTLGFGDITPTTFPLRVAVTLEGLQGFLVLTAGITWALAIKPVLAERRAFATAIHALLDAERRTGLSLADLPPDDVRPALLAFADQLALVRTRLLQSPESYYFRPDAHDASLATALPRLLDTLHRLERRPEEGIRLHAATVREALASFADVLSRQFLQGCTGTPEVLQAYAHDHLRTH